MNEIQRTLLIGIKKFGKKKTFKEILLLSGIELNDAQRVEIAYELETSGFIQAVTYGLPVQIRAELSKDGENAIPHNSNLNLFLSLRLFFSEILQRQKPLKLVLS